MTRSSASTCRRTATRGDGGFTLIEVLVVIGIIALLLGLLLPAFGAVRNSVRRTKTTSMVQNLSAALDLYAFEDSQHSYPPVEADEFLHARASGGNPMRCLDLLTDRGLTWSRSELEITAVAGSAGYLVDAWGRGMHYRADVTLDGTIWKPAALSDWNAKGVEPYAYVWSLGQPTRNSDAIDAAVANAPRWIYRKTTP